MSHKDLTRIEGNARLILERKKGEMIPKINVFESSRKFEKILVGKSCQEVPDLVSRICGICHVPHKLGAIMAIEDALNLEVGKETKLLRELLTLGGIMNSHILHLFFMVLPDLKGYDNVFEMMKKHRNTINTGLELEKLSKDIIKVVGGREIHTLTPMIGGFTRIPEKEELRELLKRLKENREKVLEAIKYFLENEKDLGFERETRYVSLKGNKNYELLKGSVISDDDIEVKPQDYRNFIKEYKVDYSNAKFSTFKGESYMVGALARLKNNGKYLPQKIKKFVKESSSPFYNINAQAIEVLYCIERAREIIENLKLKEEKREFRLGVGEGVCITEAPRGILIHYYKLNKDGKIKYANILTPTAQNLRNIEKDAGKFIKSFSKKEIECFLERLVRAYDPCISCAAHFLDVKYK